MSSSRRGRPADPSRLLPLKPDVLLVLTVLARGARHGYGILQAAETASAGEVVLRPGALYRRLSWMLDEGLIEELDGPPDHVESRDPRRRYYRVTDFGNRVARAEAARMGRAVAAARDAGLTEEGGR